MSRKLLFINQWTPIGYTKLMSYVKYIFRQFNIPFVEIEKASDLSSFVEQEQITCGLVIHSFDMIAEHGFPTFKNIKYLGLYVDPLDNIDHYFRMHGNDQNVFGSIVPFMMQHDYFKQRWPDKPVFSFYQGYVPYEDFDEDVVPFEKDIDVLAPGFNRDVPDRRQLIQELRNRGLKVVDDRLFDADLDVAMRRAKVSIYYPLFEHIRTFHSQRTLWAINKQTCVIALESGDTKCEEFYKSMGDIYVRIQDREIKQFCDRIVDIVRSGAWKTLGQRQYEIYKRNYNGVTIFDKCLLKFLKDFTSTMDTINPMDEKYHTYIQKVVESIKFDTVNIQPQFASSKIFSSFQSCFDFIVAKTNFNCSNDVVLTTKLYQPLNGLIYEFIDISNGSLNMSLLDLQHKLQNQIVKIIFVKHQYGVPTDMKLIKEYVSEYEQTHGYQPIIIEDCSTVVGCSGVGLFGNTVFVDEKCVLWSSEMPQSLNNETQTLANYTYMLEEMDDIIQKYNILIQLSFGSIGSPKFPLLFLDNQYINMFVQQLQHYNIQCEVNQELVVIPCGHSMTEDQMDYILDVIEEFFQIVH